MALEVPLDELRETAPPRWTSQSPQGFREALTMELSLPLEVFCSLEPQLELRFLMEQQFQMVSSEDTY